MCSSAISSDGQGNYGIRRNDGALARIAGGKVESEASVNKRVFEKRQAELDALANQRKQVMQQQQAKSQALQAQQAQSMAEQKTRVTQLRTQQSERLAEAKATQQGKATRLAADQAANVARLAAAQKTKLGGIRSRGEAVSSSLQILGKGSLTGPSATNTSPKARRRGAASTVAQVARGSTRSRGTKLSI